ncbi:MAG: hypothetical protein OXF06_07535 [Bacteroidetes bacterium]|nr:hypothetical protein [Bacteroidota bacterium]MCY4224674.1 hypothetical protein [Bacteroidota bacterium]
MIDSTKKRTYLDYSNQQLAEILYYSPFINVSNESSALHQLTRLPQGIDEEREAYVHSQMLHELMSRVDSSDIAHRMILCIPYEHLHYCPSHYVLRASSSDQTQIKETQPRKGIPVTLAKKYAQELMKKPSDHPKWIGWTISVFSKDGKKEIYISALLDLVKPLKKT